MDKGRSHDTWPSPPSTIGRLIEDRRMTDGRVDHRWGRAHEISPPDTIGKLVGKPNEESDGITVERSTEILLEVEVRWV